MIVRTLMRKTTSTARADCEHEKPTALISSRALRDHGLDHGPRGTVATDGDR